MNDPLRVRDPRLGFPGHAATVSRLRKVLSQRPRARVAVEGFRPAAVAVLLVNRGGETYLPFTVRSTGLRSHSGQISLPGGVREADDSSLAATACREAEEELGIVARDLELLGVVDPVPTPTGFLITPVVAEMMNPPSYAANRDEVAEVFEAPLSLFADPTAMIHMGAREYRGIKYRLIAFRYERHVIWGATARIMAQLAALARA